MRAAPGLTNTSPLAFFTSAANALLQAQPEFARLGLSVTNIPIYPTNCYTPSVHRLLQLAANLYDASTNKTATAPDDFDYPSVFRPTFGVNGTNIYINGYVEVGTNADYNAIPLFLPDQAALVTTNTTNIYGIPWIIGAKKGFPNLNQIAMQANVTLARKVQIVKPFPTADRLTWHTNIQYYLALSNTVAVEAWNSYLSNYTRPTSVIGVDNVSLYLTNSAGQVLTNNTVALPMTVVTTNWPGFPLDMANRAAVSNSFLVPLNSSVPFLPGAVFHPNGTFTLTTNLQSVPFDTTTGYPQPQLDWNITNRLRFVMLDVNSGRVIDYVHLDGLTCQQDILAELQGPDDFGPGGVWDTNRIDGSTNATMPILGVVNQIQVSLINPPCTVPGYPTPVTVTDWMKAGLPAGFASISAAVQAFDNFYFNSGSNSNIIMEVPFTPVRNMSVYSSWQANDPLVHYTLSDLTGFGDLSTMPVTNYDASIANLVQAGLFRVNKRYLPWYGTGNPQGYIYNYAYDPAFLDPNVTRSDDWIFPTGPLNFASIGQVHRGTPWQTVYLKAGDVDPGLWQNWTGNASLADAVLTQPTNDWRLAALLASLLNPAADPRQLVSVNSTNLAGTLDGIIVVSNLMTLPPSTNTFVMTSNSPQAALIVNAVNSWRAALPGGLFASAASILAVPELTTNSPWLDLTQPDPALQPTDADYEMIPSQLLPLLRCDSIGSRTWVNGAWQIQFSGFDGYAYLVQASTDLIHWTNLTTQVTTNGSFTVSDPSAGTPPRYYRTSLIPQP